MKSAIDVPSLPPHYYHDQKIYEKEMERFFLDRWLPVAREEDVAGPGEFVIRNIGAESVVIIRGQDGKVGAFHNVCRHRGARLIEEAKGSREVVQCGYHAWTYGLDGHLVGAPYMEGIEGFKMEDYGLIPVRLESWQGFLFVNLAPGSASLRSSLGDLFDKLSRFRFGEFRRPAISHTMSRPTGRFWRRTTWNATIVRPCTLNLSRSSSGTAGEERARCAAQRGWTAYTAELRSLTGKNWPA